MIAIRSTKALAYNPIQPNEEGIIELSILEVREFFDQSICVISVQDALITEIEGVETRTVLTVRSKQFTFNELEALEDLLPVPEGTYMERRIQRFKDGLLFITQNDAHPVYFSDPTDWEIV